jgi:putative Mg2+ transporter-C (MgtC) family protein
MGDAWQRIGRVIASEFSDIGDLEQATRLVVRLVLAGLLGGLLGLEREWHQKPAGLRTHMLVAMGAALFVLVSQHSGVSPNDMSRVVQGLVAGVGFLGAGTILKSEGDTRIQGLTTAAGIWLTAAIGMAVGLGREATAMISTGLALLVLVAVPACFAGLLRLTGRRPVPEESREDAQA